MSQELYYTAPKDSTFENVKQEAIKIRGTYDDQFWYATEKIARIKDIENYEDNVMFIVAMFDSNNQRTLLNNIPEEAKEEILLRM